MAQIFVSAVAHIFMSVGGSKIHERLAHFFIDIYNLATYLHDLRRRQQKQRLLLGSAYHTEWSDYVCVDAIGQLIKPDLVTRNFPLLLKRIGLRHIRFHDLRHPDVKHTTKM